MDSADPGLPSGSGFRDSHFVSNRQPKRGVSRPDARQWKDFRPLEAVNWRQQSTSVTRADDRDVPASVPVGLALQDAVLGQGSADNGAR